MQDNYTCRHCGAVRGHSFDKMTFQFRSRFCDELAGDFSAVARSLVLRAIEGHLPAIKLYFEYLMGKPGFKDFAPPPEPERARPGDALQGARIILQDENGRDLEKGEPDATGSPAVPASATVPAAQTGETPAIQETSQSQPPATATTQSAVKTPFGDGS